MRYINSISGAPYQETTLATDSGDAVALTLRYLPMQQRWLMDVAYGDFVAKGMLVACSPNFLRGFKNNIPFGIAITSTDVLDPLFLDDFATGRIKLYLLNPTDVATIESTLFQ